MKIVESFLGSFRTYKGNKLEVFINPDTIELKKVFDENEGVRGFLIGDNIVIWDLHSALHLEVFDFLTHDADKEKKEIYMPSIEDIVPIGLFKNRVQVTEYLEDLRSNFRYGDNLYEFIKNHPQLNKIFNNKEFRIYREYQDDDGHWVMEKLKESEEDYSFTDTILSQTLNFDGTDNFNNLWNLLDDTDIIFYNGNSYPKYNIEQFFKRFGVDFNNDDFEYTIKESWDPGQKYEVQVTSGLEKKSGHTGRFWFSISNARLNENIKEKLYVVKCNTNIHIGNMLLEKGKKIYILRKN